jgi:hypothetical protein
MKNPSPRSPIDILIDQACGHTPQELPPSPTKEETVLAKNLAKTVIDGLKTYYPDVLKTRPTTWPVHLKNDITNKVAQLLAKRRLP